MSTSSPAESSRTTSDSRLTRTIAWIFQGLGAVLFLFFGFGKVTGSNTEAVSTFDQIGMGQWLRVAIGALELLGAIGLLVPLVTGLAAACLAALVVGAMGVELFVVDDGNITAPLICFVVVMVVFVLRRRTITDTLAFLRQHSSPR